MKSKCQRRIRTKDGSRPCGRETENHSKFCYKCRRYLESQRFKETQAGIVTHEKVKEKIMESPIETAQIDEGFFS